MLEIKNYTSMSASLIPSLDKNGYDYAVLILKGKYQIIPNQTQLALAEEPAVICEADVHFGEPEKTSVRYESDTAMYKRATDIIVNGHAHVPGKNTVQVMEVSVQVGSMNKTCRVFGDRHWEKSGLAWGYTPPARFERMPLIYENAYGGVDKTKPAEETAPEFSTSNPLGKGFVGIKSSPQEGLALPNIEDPRHLIQKWEDRPTPAGFGFITRAWQPRVALAGTYDDQWKKKRMPLLPLDFDERYFNGAHPDLISPTLFTGGEPVTIKNMTESGLVSFALPVWNEPVKIFMKGNSKVFKPILDTVVIEPDDNSVSVTWRVTVPCFKQFLYIDTVIIGKKSSA